MDKNLKALYIKTLKFWAAKLSEDDRASASDRILRPLLTVEEFSSYERLKAELALTIIHPRPFSPHAEAYWRKCKQVIAASNRARTPQAEKNASLASEKCQEVFEELPEEDKLLFEELSIEEWGLQYPQVEFAFPVPKFRVPMKPYTGTAKNAAQRLVIDSALLRLEGDKSAIPEDKVYITRPIGLRARDD